MLVIAGPLCTEDRNQRAERLRGKLLYLAEPTITPHDLFCAGPVFSSVQRPGGPKLDVGQRFIRKRRGFRSPECLVYTDASCWNNGSEDAHAECSIAYEPLDNAPADFDERFSFMDVAHKCTADLPTRSFDGTRSYIPATSNRAKLYAAIMALTMRWGNEGWETIVVAGDLEYVVNGITDWVWKWRENGWKRSDGQPVLNVDLWEYLLDCILDLDRQGVAVKFWKVPRVKGVAHVQTAQLQYCY